jgi:hypothetical protein
MKNLRFWHRADQAEWEWDCRVGYSHQAAGRQSQVFGLCVIHCDGRDQTVHDLTENTASSLDGVERGWRSVIVQVIHVLRLKYGLWWVRHTSEGGEAKEWVIG